MSTVTVDWTEPTKRTDGSALTGADIDGTEVYLIQGTAPVLLGKVAPGGTQTITRTLTDGQYVIRHVVVDKSGRKSANVDTPITVRTVSAPNGVTSVKITVS